MINVSWTLCLLSGCWCSWFCIVSPRQGFLKSERVSRMVQSGGCSANDFREVFKKNIERRVRSLPEIDGLSKETVLSSWIAKYDAIYRGDEDMRRQPQRAHLSAVSELILSKEQLYEMFQQILGVRKFEHQLLYNACQVSRNKSTGRHGHVSQTEASGAVVPLTATRCCCRETLKHSFLFHVWLISFDESRPLMQRCAFSSMFSKFHRCVFGDHNAVKDYWGCL